ncbi:class I adenylate-forming enzyme family protein [Pseudarthrobacter sp. NPDC058329]|uniref:class I adenylate-forming enzyme family protein n=1 Tax=Pseudarthrobacter sp. NPDC058329 TaxID=3346448 RepID=UPI0036DF8A14
MSIFEPRPTPVPWIAYQAARNPDKPALIDVEAGTVISYAALRRRVLQTASALANQGITKGDRIAVVSHNSPHSFEVIYACAMLGAVVVPLNWRLNPVEIMAICEDFRPSFLFFSSDLRPLAEHILEGMPDIRSRHWGDPENDYEDFIREAPEHSPAAADPATPWVIIYTSGTTGVPKGVVHSLGSVTADIENSAYAGSINENTNSLSILPPFHVAGMNAYANPTLQRGGTVFLMRSFNADATLDLLLQPEAGITHFAAPSAVLQMMSSTTIFDTANFRPVITTVGGSPIPSALVAKWEEKGWTIITAYGATEAGSTVIARPPAGRCEAEGATGIPSIHTQCRIVHQDGSPAPDGVVGELWIRGPMLTLGYWEKPEATAEQINEEGWYRSGDAAFRDEHGCFHLVDRWKDMFISGAENVYPAEIENVLYQHPAVALAAVVGTPDERWGEVGKAFIVRAAQVECTADELRSWCQNRLARYKVPQTFEFVASMPQSGSGKILKRQLVAEADGTNRG